MNFSGLPVIRVGASGVYPGIVGTDMLSFSLTEINPLKNVVPTGSLSLGKIGDEWINVFANKLRLKPIPHVAFGAALGDIIYCSTHGVHEGYDGAWNALY